MMLKTVSTFSPSRFTTKLLLILIACLLLGEWTHYAIASPITNVALTLSSPWRYTTNNVDAENWTAPVYAEPGWSGPGNALLYIETATLPAAKNTPLPQKPGGGPMPCYYFRTTFQVTNASDTVSLIFSNLIDDGAVFYLNGIELYRVRMNPGTVTYTNLASSLPPGGDATAIETYAVTGPLLTNLVEGTNVLAARVHQQATTSSDIVFGSALAVVTDPNPTPLITRLPYLQACADSSIVIRWRTDRPCNSQIVYGADLASMNLTNYDATLVTEHEIQLTNLLSDAVYYYAVGTSDLTLAGFSTNHYFRTHPLPGARKPLHIWVTGDAGTKDANQQAVRDAFYAMNDSKFVDAWLLLGDNAYETGLDSEYQAAVFDMYSALIPHTVIWPALGNHETYSSDTNGLFPYLSIFSVPTNGVAGGIPSGTRLYYSYDIGMVHFICLDSMTSARGSNQPMALWLKADLQATTNRWLISYWHHPPYSKGSHDSDTEEELIEMRQNILPILEAGGVDLVLGGHSHVYERSYLLDGHYGFSTNLTPAMILNSGSGRETNGIGAYVKPENFVGSPVDHYGAVYVVAGSSGQISGGALNHPAMFVSLNVLGSVVMDVSTNRLDAIFLRETGVTNDWFTIIKTNYAPVASNLVFTIDADATTNLVLGGADVNRNPLTFVAAALPTNGLVSAFDPATGQFSYTPAHGSTNSDTFSFALTDGQLSSDPATITFNLRPDVDTNQNGLPDAWEMTYGVTDPNGDDDGDGVTNLQEYRAGTNPTNSLSWLRIVDINQGQNGYQLVWSAVGGVRYRVLYSDGDAQSSFNGLFTPLARPVTQEMDADPVGTAGTMSFTDDFTLTGRPPANGARYFRIQVVR